MFTRRRSISLLLILSAPWLSGCHTTHAHSSPSRPSAAQEQTATPPAAKHPLRDSALSTYHNPTHGVSFRYPKNYLLDDYSGSEDEPSRIEAWRGLNSRQPGALLVATVTIPPDAYPNTTFGSGSLQLAVHPNVTPEACRSFAAPADDAYTLGSTTVQGVIFDWRQRGFAAAGTASLDRDYAGFSNGTCYEFFLEIVTGSNPELDPRIKDADEVKIMHALERIVSSLQIHNPHSFSHPR